MHPVEIYFILIILRITLAQNQCEYSIQEGFQYTPTTNGSGSFRLVGNVNDVLQGIITTHINETLWTYESTGEFGFGAAAVGSLEGLGEAVFVNGNAYVRQTDNRTENYFETITGNEFRTPFSLFVSNGISPDGHVVFYSQHNFTHISMFTFYERVYQAVGTQAFCFYGLTEFAQLEAVAVSKAPIYNEPLFDDESYYMQPNFHLPNEYGLTFGCAANFSTIRDSALNDILLKVFYLNPYDPASRGDLQVHSHVLSLSKCLQSPGEIDTSTAGGVYHMLSTTTISYISAQVYTLSSSDKIIELTAKNNAHSFGSLLEIVYVALWLHMYHLFL